MVSSPPEQVSGAADEPFVPAPDRRLGERYRLVRLLGRGGMAAVWLAFDERLEREVAVKLLSDTVAGDSEFLTRFAREARLAAGLQHPNLVSVYDFSAHGRPYLVMEYVPGGDLRRRLEAGDTPEPERFARELLAALRHIHAAGVLHRDVKPGNILVGPEGRALLTDFGIARLQDATALTKTGEVVGTESYLAPEVLGGALASERSDLYSAGCVLAEVAGKSGAPARVWDLIGRLRARSPEERPASAATALAAIEAAEPPDGEPTVAFEPPTPVTAVEPVTPAAPLARGLGEPAQDVPELVTGSQLPPARHAPPALLRAGVAAVIVLALIGAVAIVAGGDGEPSTQEPAAGREQTAGAADKRDGEGARGSQEAAAGEEEGEAAADLPADGYALNEQGKALIDAERPDEAIPLLERAIDLLRESDELYYNYALFNLGNALRLAGRPADAIPHLEERLEYPDQRDVVAAELAAAREEAGLESGGIAADEDGGDEASGAIEAKPGKGPKKPKKSR